jgi:hypothetical protein
MIRAELQLNMIWLTCWHLLACARTNTMIVRWCLSSTQLQLHVIMMKCDSMTRTHRMNEHVVVLSILILERHLSIFIPIYFSYVHTSAIEITKRNLSWINIVSFDCYLPVDLCTHRLFSCSNKTRYLCIWHHSYSVDKSMKSCESQSCSMNNFKMYLSCSSVICLHQWSN